MYSIRFIGLHSNVIHEALYHERDLFLRKQKEVLDNYTKLKKLENKIMWLADDYCSLQVNLGAIAAIQSGALENMLKRNKDLKEFQDDLEERPKIGIHA